LTYCDNCWTLLATRNAQSLTLSKKDIPLFFYPYSALPPAIQLHLPTASSLNTCATVIPPPWKIFTSFAQWKWKKLFKCHVHLHPLQLHTKIKLI